jgi:hypothetical protein
MDDSVARTLYNMRVDGATKFIATCTKVVAAMAF